MAGKRRKARVAALKALFESDSVGHHADQILERFSQEVFLPDDAAEFARQLVQGVIDNRERLDEIIRKNAPAWPLEQVAAVDRNILRLAIYEIVIDNRVPMLRSSAARLRRNSSTGFWVPSLRRAQGGESWQPYLSAYVTSS